METFAVAVTLFLIMDPLGNIPIFLSVLSKVTPERRIKILIRELIIALMIMLLFLFSGPVILKVLGLSREAVAIGGGLVLMIIAIRMIFPSRGGVMGDDGSDGEPLVVPLAVPLIAGPSVLATLVLLADTGPERSVDWLMALGGAWFLSAIILLSSQGLFKLLGARGLKAIERLMGMILISISVQMLLDGFKSYMG
ncbi:YhgN family NAAT transporter [Nitrincola sp. MINF-07-Sa-05]|uniref:YhgN family NAAT transporter n=1 Tax=Nitrincola salilacus TaxID=3400273 RepID=UPI003918434B